ncbi:MAG TPA: sugar ABC transporter ATP-binding protein [Gemmataceae bacterium]|nr:sugar ABC transporter ATP-binding protein [Gemmataceae bacterium]
MAKSSEIPCPPGRVLRLRMEGIAKRFGSTQALRSINLEVVPGEVHALIGENGAGKSTLMKILSGAEKPDAGLMTLDTEPYQPSGPQEARLRGVAMIYQELALAPHLNVETNVMLGLEESRWGFVRGQVHRQRVREALALLQHPEIRPETPVKRLSPAACQLVEVARALIVDARVIVLDEPTSSLTWRDTEHLFALVRRLKTRGVSIIYISHFLEEVQRIADRYTVLRDGRTTGTGLVAGTPLEAIIEEMVGRSVRDLYPKVPHSQGHSVLRVRNLAGKILPSCADLTLHRGEILGIFGLVGAGRTETLRTLFGLDPVLDGEIQVLGKLETRANPRNRISRGIGFLSEDRKQESLALSQSIADNLTYSRLEPYTWAGWLNLSRRQKAVRTWLERLHIRCRRPEQKVVELSGGNQQKVALARLLHQQADILLLDEPTRGIDVGSKAEIYRLIGALAQQGKAIIFVSSYLPELVGVCDNLAVMSRGRLNPGRPVTEWTTEQIMAAATGGGDS